MHCTVTIPQNLSQAEKLLLQYPSLTSGIGKLKNFQVKLQTDQSVQPIVHLLRRIPLHMRKTVEEELQCLEDQGNIEKVEGLIPWISPIVAFPKPKNPEKIHFCIDMCLPNTAVQRERHTAPTVDDIMHDLNGVTMFSKLDLTQVITN